MRLYHYTRKVWLPSILHHRALWPSPPLRLSGLNREEVERDPARFDFLEERIYGRRCFSSHVPVPDLPGVVHKGMGWVEGQVFDVGLTRADWCHCAMSNFPKAFQERGDFWRLVIETEGLDLTGWRDYQRRANLPALYRRCLAKMARSLGDDPNDWYFFFGEMPLDGHLTEMEQYCRGRWTRMSDISRQAPLAEMPQARRLFEATFTGVEDAPGLTGRSLFVGVSLDGRLVAGQVWVRQTWEHLAPDDLCRFLATVVPDTRRDGTPGWTLADVDGLEVVGNVDARLFPDDIWRRWPGSGG
jgi:hypothetical protein